MNSSQDAFKKLKEMRLLLAHQDRQIFQVYAQRMQLARAIGALKKQLQIAVIDQSAENEVRRNAAECARELGIDQEKMAQLMDILIKHSCEIQEKSGSA